MGAWSCSITGNDTAQDLIPEYQIAFYYYDVDTALEKIDEYVRTMFDEEDEEEWCCYYYSLADFMWKKGILTETVKNKALEMIDSGFGLEIWEESGKSVLKSRKKALQKFREKLLSQQPEKKKIRISLNIEEVFKPGEIVAFKLRTSDKSYIEKDSNFTEETFRKADGKYIVVRKIEDHISYYSQIVPEIANHWCVFQLYDKIFEQCPTIDDLKDIPYTKIANRINIHDKEKKPYFLCESKLFYFKKRDYHVLGKNIDGIPDKPVEFNDTEDIFFGINKPFYNIDTYLLDSITNI